MGLIELKGMHFHSCHGCLESERRDGNEFLVDVAFEYDMSAACLSDDLTQAVDYSRVYSLVKEEMDRPSNLIENVAWRIRKRITESFPNLDSVTVTVSKSNPPVGGRVDWSTVTL